MTNGRMEELLKKEFGEERVEGQAGAWRIVLEEDDEEKTDEDEKRGKDESDETTEIPSEPKDSDSSESDSSDLNPDGNESDEDENEENDESDEANPDNEQLGGVEIPGASDEEKLPPIMVVMTDNRADRMRLMMPIRSFDPRKAADLRLALIALHSNYDRALDSRYALQDGVLWSIFIHPLESLTEDDLKNAIAQVRTLRKNTGKTFSSSDMMFGAVAPEAREETESSDF